MLIHPSTDPETHTSINLSIIYPPIDQPVPTHSSIHPPINKFGPFIQALSIQLIHPFSQPPSHPPIPSLTHLSTYPYIYSSNHPLFYPLTYPYSQSSIHQLIHPLTHPSTNPSIHSLTHTHPPIHTLIQTPTHLFICPLCIHPFINVYHPSIHPCTHPITYTFINPSIYTSIPLFIKSSTLPSTRSLIYCIQSSIYPSVNDLQVPQTLELRLHMNC